MEVRNRKSNNIKSNENAAEAANRGEKQKADKSGKWLMILVIFSCSVGIAYHTNYFKLNLKKLNSTAIK
jgi:hypothetical protein